MIEFKPRLAAFYVVAFVIVALLSNRVTVTSQKAAASLPSTTIVDTSK